MNWLNNKISKLSKLDVYEKPSGKGLLKMNSNENFVIDTQYQSNIITKASKNCDVRAYPENHEDFIKCLSKYHKISTNKIGIGSGSDQIIDLLLTNFASKRIKILISNPTFSFFEARCRLYSLRTIKVPFSDSMILNFNQFMSKFDDADMLYLDSPNNPTGFQFSKLDLREIIDCFDGPVIIDEAYVDFAGYNVVDLTKKYDNLIVVKTFSKAFGFAGLRLGYFIADQNIVNVFMKAIQYPYPINSIALEAGKLLLQNIKKLSGIINLIKNERNKMILNLRKLNAFEVFNSQANFVLFDAKDDYLRIYTALAEQGILIKKLGRIGTHKGCLRVTIGTKDMNSKFIIAIRDLLR